MGSDVRISDAEWDVMEFVWERGTVTASDVISSVGTARRWNQSTVRTLLARLVEKGALGYEEHANRYLYRSAVSRKRCVKQEGRSFLERVFGGDVNSLLAHFVKEGELTEADVEALKRLAAKKSRGKE
jgi:BlaI family transcriptional regulator, penicillinase repressor